MSPKNISEKKCFKNLIRLSIVYFYITGSSGFTCKKDFVPKVYLSELRIGKSANSDYLHL